MASGDKSSYTDKQKRQAEHIEEGYEKRGRSGTEAERIAWSTVNKETGGGLKGGSSESHQSRHNGSHSSNGSTTRTRTARSEAAKRGWATRRSKDALK